MKKIIRAAFISIIIAVCFIFSSCASTGEYLPLKENEKVIGTAQATFYVQSSFFFMNKVKDSINKQAYYTLMEAAGKKYEGNIDIRDINWVTGDSSPDRTKTAIFATSKVIVIE